jgi:3-phosphoshikimate 1-carboxyvinyltransferase
MTFLDLPAATRARGNVRLPGSKSISNRALLLAAVAEGTTRLDGLLKADDTTVMIGALMELGIPFIDAVDGRTRGQTAPDFPARVQGIGGVFSVKAAELFLANAGTAFRPLAAALAVSGGEYRLHGVPRMHERPIGDLVDALRSIGARIDYEATEGFPPLRIHPAEIRPDRPVRVRGEVSSQFLTALLLALPLAGGGRIEVAGDLISKPYIEITLNLMRRFGVNVSRQDWSAFDVPAGPYVSPGQIVVEGDASAASYFLAAGAIGRGPVMVHGVGRDSIQGDIRLRPRHARRWQDGVSCGAAACTA